MAKHDITDLLRFIYQFNPEVREKVIRLREFVWDLYPQANELIYDNYNALAIGWSPTEKMGHIFCSVAVYRVNQGMHFGFYRGSELADPQKLLLGEGNQYRYLRADDIDSFPTEYATGLIEQAWHNSLQKVKNPKYITSGKTITKSVSTAKREKSSKAKTK